MLAVSYGVTASQGLKIELSLPVHPGAAHWGHPSAVNQILKDWELEGMVGQRYGRITLLDRARLEKLVRL
jgi:hypothetical protein